MYWLLCLTDFVFSVPPDTHEQTWPRPGEFCHLQRWKSKRRWRRLLLAIPTLSHLSHFLSLTLFLKFPNRTLTFHVTCEIFLPPQYVSSVPSEINIFLAYFQQPFFLSFWHVSLKKKNCAKNYHNLEMLLISTCAGWAMARSLMKISNFSLIETQDEVGCFIEGRKVQFGHVSQCRRGKKNHYPIGDFSVIAFLHLLLLRSVLRLTVFCYQPKRHLLDMHSLCLVRSFKGLYQDSC